MKQSRPQKVSESTNQAEAESASDERKQDSSTKAGDGEKKHKKHKKNLKSE
jgi:hypothetical protein